MFVCQSALELLSGKRKSQREIWKTKREKTQKKNCPQPVRSSQRNPRIVPGMNLNALTTAGACVANWAACVTRLYEHISKTAANRDTI